MSLYAPAPPATPPQPTEPTPAPQPARPRRSILELVTVGTVAALIGSGATYAVGQTVTDTGASTTTSSVATNTSRSAVAPVVQADPSNPDWSAVAKAVSPSVVAITVRSAGGTGQGSGVVIDDSGHVLTNNHVVGGARQLTVTTADGRTYDATVAGTDPATDLAVVTITNPPRDLPKIAVGDSTKLAVGDPVMAVGNPLGLAGTVTTGIVSALNRPVSTQAEGSPGPFGGSRSEPVVTNAIQTSAAINPGNSGGALVNGSGELVGINSSIATLGGVGQSGNIGIGFAIPANEAMTIAHQLIADGRATHAYLGITPTDGTARDGSAERAGAEVATVQPGSPADAAGLRVGDTIVAINGIPVESALSLVGHIRASTVGESVTLTVLRDGTSTTLTATLVARPTSA